MANATTKGNINQNLIRKIKEKQGYTVHVTTRTSKFLPWLNKGKGGWMSQSNDVFGCVDLICLKPGKPVEFVQAASAKTSTSSHRPKMEAVQWPFEHCVVELWDWVGGVRRVGKRTGKELQRQGFRVRRLVQDPARGLSWDLTWWVPKEAAE